METTSEWVWSHDGERFNGGPEESRDIALEAAKSEGATHIGRKVVYVPFDWDVIDHLMEQEGCEASEEVGEIADSWPCFNPCLEEAYKAAREKVAAIMRDLVGEPDFYKVEDMEEITDDVE